jgi:nicotinamide riboside kinase
MKRIICLWGGPGTGKSTTAAGVFSGLKKLNYNVELNREYIKDWVWEKRELIDGDQVYITAKQARKERIYMKQGLDFIITDSPLALTTFYGNIYDKYEKEHGACKQIVKQHWSFCRDHGYKVDHFFLTRAMEYQAAGRFQTEEQAKALDIQLKTFLKEYPINYVEVACDENVEDNILEFYKTLKEKK